jgi:hypothetical protein
MGALDRLLNPTAAPAPAAKPAASSSGGALDRLLQDPGRTASPVSTEGGLDLGPDPGLSFDGEESFFTGAGGMPSRTTRSQRRVLQEVSDAQDAEKARVEAAQLRAFGLKRPRQGLDDVEWWKSKFSALGYQAAAGLADVLDTPLELLDGAATTAAQLYARRGIVKAGIAGDEKTVRSLQKDQVRAGQKTSFGSPVKAQFREWGFLERDIKTASEIVNGTIGEWLERGAEAVATKDRTVAPEDVSLAVESAFTLLGGMGVRSTTAAARKRVNLGAAQLAVKLLEAETEARRALEQENFDTFQNAGGGAADATRASRTTLQPARLRLLELEDKLRGGYPFNATEIRQALDAAADSERTGLREATELTNTPGATRPYGVPGDPIDQSFQMTSLAEDARRRGLATEVPSATRGELGVPQNSLTTALEKVKSGQLFSMTAEERIALRGLAADKAQRLIDPKLTAQLSRYLGRSETLAAVGATGLGLAMLYEPDSSETALAVGAGALMLGRGREPLKIEALRALPDATPLGSILDRSPYTLSTLELLPKNRFEFTVGELKSLLERPYVSATEKAILRDAIEGSRTAFLAEKPESRITLPPGGFRRVSDRDTITAKQLMLGVKEATGDFELTPRASEKFADYGLANLGRVERSTGNWQDWIPEDATPEETARIEAEGRAVEANAPVATTTIYQSPIELGSNNHFGDPNYFAHTRSFTEGGVRHVVELQSDLAQKAKRELAPVERAELVEQSHRAREGARIWSRVGFVAGRAGDYDFWKALETFKKEETTLSRALGHTDQTMMLENKLLKNMNEGGVEAAAVASKFAESKLKDFSPEEIASYERGYVDISEGFVDWLLENRALLPREDARVMRDVLARYSAAKFQDFQVMGAEVAAKLQATAADPVRPMLKDWHKRLIREEMAQSARADQPTIRFATADTVAKVEGWPEAETTRARGNYADAASIEESGTRFLPEHQGIYDRYAGDVTKFLKQLGGKEITDSAGHTWIEVPLEPKKSGPPLTRTQMFSAGAGSALALYAFQDDPEGAQQTAAALFGLGIMAKSRTRAIAENAGEVVRGFDYSLGVLSTRIRSVDEALARRVRGFEMGLLAGNHERLAVASPFVERLSTAMKVADGPLKARVRAALLDGRPERVLTALGALGDPDLVKEWRKNRDSLVATGRTLKNAGLIKELAPDYFPRMVVDYEGLVKFLGDEGSELDRLIQREQQRSLLQSGEELSPLEVSDLINRWMTRGVGGKPGFLRGRSSRVDELTTDIARFYAAPEESLLLYNRAATAAIERAKFFGKSAVLDPETGKINLSASIGAVVEEVRQRKKLTTQQERDLRSMLQSRFGPGQRDMHKYLQDLRNVTNMGLLGHVTSAVVQSGDLAVAAVMHGILPTIKSALETVTGKSQRYQLRDLGIVDHWAEEFTSSRGSARALNKVFKWSGFNLVDKFAKETTLNAALRNYTEKSKTVGGQAKIQEKYGEYFGRDDLGKLISDLRAGRRTDLVDELLFGELSDLQPISRSEVPQMYLDAGKFAGGSARMLYQLKTFMVKQLDIYRNQVYREARAGRGKQATANALKISVALGVGGATTEFIRNWMLGRDDELEWKDIPLNLLKVFGWSEWLLRDQANDKRLSAYLGGMILPPHSAWTAAVTLDPKAINLIPLVGRALYSHDPFNLMEESGAEKFNRVKSEKERRELNRRLNGLTEEQMEVLDRIKKAERIR